MAEPKGVMIYLDYLDHLERLDDDECGKLFKGILSYARFGELPALDGAAMMAFSFIRAQIDRDFAKYDKICERNRRNGAKGGRPTKATTNPEEPNKPSGLFGNPEEPKKANTNTKKNTNTKTNTPPISPKGGDERFSIFWSAYPKKLGKGAAEKAWKKIAPSSELLTTMLNAIAAAKQSDQWQRDNGQYIPSPSTWLNQKRWEDELGADSQDSNPPDQQTISKSGRVIQ